MAMRSIFLAAALALAAVPAAAVSSSGKAANDRWTSADDCAKRAHALFPDWTREHAAKRDAFLRKCLAEKRLPGRNPVAPKG
jgi:hypothetical protein